MVYPNVLQEEDNDIVFASYNDLQKRGEDLPPFEYYQLYADTDYQRSGFGLVKPSPDHITGWIKGISLFNSNKEVLIPAQMAFPGYKIKSQRGEKRWAPGFSTGAASGTNYKRALQGAIAEFVEIDAFNIHWFTERKAQKISFAGTILEDIIKQIFDGTDFEPIMIYHTLEDIKIHTMSTFIINKKGLLPAISAGSQSSLDPVHCAYRSLVEATAVSLLGIVGYVYQPLLFTGYKDPTAIANLDSNVAFYSEPKNQELGMNIINKLIDQKGLIYLCEVANYSSQHHNKEQREDDDLLHVIKEIKKISKHAATINITTPDAKSLGFHVIKVFIPELMYMSHPSYPYTNHPRMKNYGGVKNKYPHPLP
jgi:thiazole/oxazole-forming peptide maturase SagD family component